MITKQPIHIFWFRRDLRLHDNAGLFQALSSANPVLPIFIFDKNILEVLEDKQDKRITFIHQALMEIQKQLLALGSSLQVLYNTPLEAFQILTEKYHIKAVFTNHDYEPYAKQRDTEIQKFLDSKGIVLRTFKDQCIFEKQEVLSNTGTPYTVFTPYSKKWKSLVTDQHLQSYDTESYFGNFLKTEPLYTPSIAELGFIAVEQNFPNKTIREDIVQNYTEKRNFPAIEGTSRLSVHLRFGTISIRELARKAQSLNESFLNELIWRDFYMMILWNFPHAATNAFRAEYEKIEWRNNKEEFEKWCNGQTGYPIVDAGMRELNETGFMHNRVRMIVASFLTKHLLIDWRWGEAYFAKKLLDFDLSANNGGWQWASSSGCDAAPYFRIFNPTEQTKKFDPQLTYIKRWVKELSDFSYPKPIVEHTFARQRALDAYKKGLEKKV
ncbi:MAG: DNA photolyase family protein [Raineya sp.]|jgi:deoxyribodipyrimidine photo-lyase|nr:DNA photolyase family protein [Raineya sp.]